jgi:hypothetical protein
LIFASLPVVCNTQCVAHRWRLATTGMTYQGWGYEAMTTHAVGSAGSRPVSAVPMLVPVVLMPVQDNASKLPQLQRQLAPALGLTLAAIDYELESIFEHPEREDLIKQILRQVSTQDQAYLSIY